MNRGHRSSAGALFLAACVVSVLAVVGGTASAKGQRQLATGGTLKMLGAGDVSNLDPVSDYLLPGTGLTRMFARQLLSYPDNADFVKASALAPDAATVVPTTGNGGISSDGLTYTFHLRPGVMWDTRPARAVTAADWVRGFEMLCNPASPTGAPGYYTSTISGMAAYCAGLSKVPAKTPAIAAYLKAHALAGVVAKNPTTVVFTLKRPASDFLNILAMGFASARPVEYMDYLPDSAQFRQHTISDGPYAIVKYVPNKEIDLDRNPAWKASADPLRKAYVDHVQIVEGLSTENTQQQIEAGTGDMDWDDNPPTEAVPRLLAAKDPRLVVAPNGPFYVSLNYVAVNRYAGPMKNLLIRQAVATAIDKNTMVQLSGGPKLNAPADQMLLPGSSGYADGYNAFPANNGNGNAAAAKALIAKAGLGKSPTIKVLYPTVGLSTKIAEALQSQLNAAGFNAQLVASSPSDYFGKYLIDPNSAKRDAWDITPVAWGPDWYGNNGRSIIQPLFTNPGPNSSDYGGYSNTALDSLISQALAAKTPAAASATWQKADAMVVADVGDIPLTYAKQPYMHSSRVQNCHPLSTSLNCDPTNVSLG